MAKHARAILLYSIRNHIACRDRRVCRSTTLTESDNLKCYPGNDKYDSAEDLTKTVQGPNWKIST